MTPSTESPVIVVDPDIPYALDIIGNTAGVAFVENIGSSARASFFTDARAIIVRSSTRIDERFLRQCRNLEVIATPVIGLDHVDRGALATWAMLNHREPPVVINAPGSTASGVADWIVWAILRWARHMRLDPLSLVVGLVGYGHCGTAVARRLTRLGISWKSNDPPLALKDLNFRSTPLDEVLSCDVVCLTVPLTTAGESEFPTMGIIDVDQVKALIADKRRRLLVNTSRGEVLSQSAGDLLRCEQMPDLALDVFVNEPSPDPQMVARALVATPHIAGNIRQGRYKAMCDVARKTYRLLELSIGDLNCDNAPVSKTRISVEADLAEIEDVIKNTGLDQVALEFMRSFVECPEGARTRVFSGIRKSAMRDGIAWCGLGEGDVADCSGSPAESR